MAANAVYASDDGMQSNTSTSNAAVDTDASEMDVPVHPIPSLQGAFEESIFESTEENAMPPVPIEVDAHARRHRLLEAKKYDDSWIGRWNQRPTARYHPLLKLMAQIVFGMHLLQQQQARSDKEVVKILQTHVNEVDTFLERTAEDFTVAIRDAEDRIRCLRLPMTHLDVFQTMLGDQRFRSQLLTGNEKIEKIIERTTRAMKAYLLDVEVGVQANRDLHAFMKNIQDRWPQDQRAIADVYSAMKGNEQGWKRYLRDLQHKGTVLSDLLASLQKLIDDMSRMATDARTKSRIESATTTATALAPTPAPSTPSTHSTTSPDPATKSPTIPSPSLDSRPANLDKAPAAQSAAIRTPTTAAASISNASTPRPFAERYDRPRQVPQEHSSPRYTPATPSTGILHPRPKTAGEARSTPKHVRGADIRSQPNEVVDFRQRPDPLRSNPNPLRSNPNPLRSNPPEVAEVSLPLRTSADTTHYSHRSNSGADTNVIVGTLGFGHDGAKVARAMDVVSVSTKSVDLTRTSTRGTDASRGQQSANSRTAPVPEVNTAAENAEKRAAMKNTGFARRLSKRLKHLPVDVTPPPPSPTRPTATTAPMPSMPTPSVTMSPQQFRPRTSSRQPPSPPDSAYASIKGDATPIYPTQQPLKPRPISGLGPLPFENQVMNSLRSVKVDDAVEQRHGSVSSKAEVRSMSSNKSRGSGIKSLFRSKWKASKEVVAA